MINFAVRLLGSGNRADLPPHHASLNIAGCLLGTATGAPAG